MIVPVCTPTIAARRSQRPVRDGRGSDWPPTSTVLCLGTRLCLSIAPFSKQSPVSCHQNTPLAIIDGSSQWLSYLECNTKSLSPANLMGTCGVGTNFARRVESSRGWSKRAGYELGMWRDCEGHASSTHKDASAHAQISLCCALMHTGWKLAGALD